MDVDFILNEFNKTQKDIDQFMGKSHINRDKSFSIISKKAAILKQVREATSKKVKKKVEVKPLSIVGKAVQKTGNVLKNGGKLIKDTTKSLGRVGVNYTIVNMNNNISALKVIGKKILNLPI